jgi:hypothetical protein
MNSGGTCTCTFVHIIIQEAMSSIALLQLSSLSVRSQVTFSVASVQNSI